MNAPPRILICSADSLTASGASANLGDQALSEALQRALEAALPGAQVARTIALLPGAEAPEGRIPLRPISGLLRAIRNSDLVVLGGGTLFQKDRPAGKRLLAGHPRYLLTVALAARRFRVPLHGAFLGAENLGGFPERRALAFVRRSCRSFSVRDRRSAEIVQSLGGRPPLLAADAMFLEAGADPALAAASAVGARAERRIAVNLRSDLDPAIRRGIAGYLRRKADEGCRILLVATDRRAEEDPRALEVLAREIGRPERCLWSDPRSDWPGLAAELADSELALGMRLHFLIFSALLGLPIVALTSKPKDRSFVEDLGVAAFEVGERRPAGVEEEVASALASVAHEAAPPDPLRLRILRERAGRGLAAILEEIEADAEATEGARR